MAVTTRSRDPRYLRELGRAGIKIFFVICDTEWLNPDAMKELRASADALLSAVPDAYVFLRVSLHPPISWMERHREELVTYNGDMQIPINPVSRTGHLGKLPAMYSLASYKWRTDGSKALV